MKILFLLFLFISLPLISMDRTKLDAVGITLPTFLAATEFARSYQRDRDTELFVAIEAGILSVVRGALQRGASCHARDRHGNTPLHEAVRGGNFDIVAYFLALKTDLNAQNNQGETPLALASDNRKIQLALIALGAQRESAEELSSSEAVSELIKLHNVSIHNLIWLLLAAIRLNCREVSMFIAEKLAQLDRVGFERKLYLCFEQALEMNHLKLVAFIFNYLIDSAAAKEYYQGSLKETDDGRERRKFERMLEVIVKSEALPVLQDAKMNLLPLPAPLIYWTLVYLQARGLFAPPSSLL